MRRDDGLVRLHHVPRERALEPSVGLGDEAAPRAAQERSQGWGGLGGRHFLLSISTRVEFFFFSSSCFDFLRQGQRRAALALSLFSLFFFLFSFLFSLFPSPSNSSSLPPWPPCRGSSPRRRSPPRLPPHAPTRPAAPSPPPRPRCRRRRCRRRRSHLALLPRSPASQLLPRSAPLPPPLRRDAASLLSLRGE